MTRTSQDIRSSGNRVRYLAALAVSATLGWPLAPAVAQTSACAQVQADDQQKSQQPAAYPPHEVAAARNRLSACQQERERQGGPGPGGARHHARCRVRDAQERKPGVQM